MEILKGSKKLLSIWKNDPVKFGMDIFPRFFSDDPGAVHPALAYDLLKPKKLFTIIMVTRDAAKSIYGSMLMPIHKMLFQDFKYIILASLSNHRATQLIGDIKVALTSDRFVDMFGQFKPESNEYAWSRNEAVAISRKHNRKCLFHARSEEAQIAGLRFEDSRPQLFVADDIEDEKSVQSDDLIEKKMKWITETVKFGLDPKKQEIFVIGTVYKSNSMLMRLSKLKRNVTVIKYPMLADLKTVKKLNRFLPNKYLPQIKSIDVGESIWEARHPTAKILQEREDANANGTLDSWNRQRQLDASEDSMSNFMEEDIQIYDPKDIKGIDMNFYILTDLAYKKGRKNDETGIVAFGVDKDEGIYVLEAIKGRWGDQTFVNKFVSVLAKYVKDPDMHIKFGGVESYAIGFVKTLLYRGLAERSMSLYIRELNPAARHKEDRIRAMVPLCEKRQIHIQKRHYELKDEMIRFHGEANQKGLNMLDAFSYYNDVCNKAEVKETTGLGSVKNRKAWESFIETHGPSIGGYAGRRRDNEEDMQIQASWY